MDEALDRLIKKFEHLSEAERRNLKETVGSTEEFPERLEEMGKTDPHFQAVRGPYAPKDIKVAEEYEKAIWGTPTTIWGVKLKENLPKPEDIEIPEELQRAGLKKQ